MHLACSRLSMMWRQGLVNCFEGFSTFAAEPLVNVHDVSVVDTFRGLGLSHKMLEKVEDIARERGCCKITLEVLEGNPVAQGAYRKFGFSDGQLDPGLRAHAVLE